MTGNSTNQEEKSGPMIMPGYLCIQINDGVTEVSTTPPEIAHQEAFDNEQANKKARTEN